MMRTGRLALGLWVGVIAAISGERAASADASAAADDDSLVWADNCQRDTRFPHAMYCLSQTLMPKSKAAARRIGPFTAPPDAGAGVDAGLAITACSGQAGGGSGNGAPAGLAPSDYAKAYAIPASPTGAGKVVAIVDACDETTVVSDLAAYRSQYNLPALPQCGGANGVAPTPGGSPCFGVVSQRGDGILPPADGDWAGEIALDVEMVSAACPLCSIVLVEADSPNSWDLGPAVDEAVALGANAVSNSYGMIEDPKDPVGGALYSDGAFAKYYDHPGVLIAVASGDDAFNNINMPSGPTSQANTESLAPAPSFPSTYPSVLSVGGTVLTASSSAARGYTEKLWTGSTSGCSTEFAAPAYQSGLDLGSCTMRADVDVAAPARNVSVYVAGGWESLAGTSCASPFVAGLLTRLGLSSQPNAFFYANGGAFFDITSGSNASTSGCTGILCNAGTGWDGPTGWGSPNAAALSAIDAGVSDDDAGSTGNDAGGSSDAGTPAGDASTGIADAGAPDATLGTDASLPPSNDAGGGDDSGAVGSNDSGAVASNDSGPPPSEDSGGIGVVTPAPEAGPVLSDDSGPGTTPASDAGDNGASGGSSGCGCEVVASHATDPARFGATFLALGALVAVRRRKKG
jgi:hypothetical protein